VRSASIRAWVLSVLLHASILALLPPIDRGDPARESPALVRVEFFEISRIAPNASLSASAGGGVMGDLAVRFRPRRSGEAPGAQVPPPRASGPGGEVKAQRATPSVPERPPRADEGAEGPSIGGGGDGTSGASAPWGGGKGASGEGPSPVELRPVSAPLPEYPVQSRRLRREGEVLLRVLVLPDGRVGKVEVERSSGFEELDRSALRAVRGWLFSPPGREVWASLPVVFRLR